MGTKYSFFVSVHMTCVTSNSIPINMKPEIQINIIQRKSDLGDVQTNREQISQNSYVSHHLKNWSNMMIKKS